MLGQVRLEDAYLSTEASTLTGGQLTHCTMSLKSKDSRGDRKREMKRKRGWKAKELHRPNKTKIGICDYTDVALVLLNHLKLIMNLWRPLMSAVKEDPAKDPQSQLTKGQAVTESLTPPHRYIRCNS